MTVAVRSSRKKPVTSQTSKKKTIWVGLGEDVQEVLRKLGDVFTVDHDACSLMERYFFSSSEKKEVPYKTLCVRDLGYHEGMTLGEVIVNLIERGEKPFTTGEAVAQVRLNMVHGEVKECFLAFLMDPESDEPSDSGLDILLVGNNLEERYLRGQRASLTVECGPNTKVLVVG